MTAFLFLAITALPGAMPASRTLEFDTHEVTAPDVLISPDGKVLFFTLLGHIFRLPVEGGNAEQLTFGPFYDTDPAISPDGGRFAFVSDRDVGAIYLGQSGRLWKVLVPAGARFPIPFSAHVKVEVLPPTPPSQPRIAGRRAFPRSLITPILSPDGTTLIFGSPGKLWEGLSAKV